MSKTTELKEQIREIRKEATDFFQNTENSFEDRFEMFKEFGWNDNSMPSFQNKSLNLIEECISESDMYQKYENVNMIDMIRDWWVEKFIAGRMSFDKSNSYHWVMVFEERNYTLSEEALYRYERYLLNKLMENGTKSYDLNW